MRRVWLGLCLLMLTACGRDYVIDLRQVNIGKSPDGQYIGYVLLDKQSPRFMKKSGEVYIYAKRCVSDSCPVFHVGVAEGDDSIDVGESARLELDLHNYDLSSKRPDDWMKDFVCIRLVAYGYGFGRRGASEWNCSMKFTS